MSSLLKVTPDHMHWKRRTEDKGAALSSETAAAANQEQSTTQVMARNSLRAMFDTSPCPLHAFLEQKVASGTVSKAPAAVGPCHVHLCKSTAEVHNPQMPKAPHAAECQKTSVPKNPVLS